MIKKNQQDVLSIFSNFKKVLENKPPINDMFEDVRMMKFKIRPISGDITTLQLKNSRLIETIWSLGKLDAIFQKELKKLNQPQKEVFFRLFDNLYQQFQNQPNTVRLDPKKNLRASPMLEMEIFKELLVKKKIN